MCVYVGGGGGEGGNSEEKIKRKESIKMRIMDYKLWTARTSGGNGYEVHTEKDGNIAAARHHITGWRATSKGLITMRDVVQSSSYSLIQASSLCSWKNNDLFWYHLQKMPIPQQPALCPASTQKQCLHTCCKCLHKPRLTANVFPLKASGFCSS